MSTHSVGSTKEHIFTPRKEFRRDARVQNTFSLLAFSGSNMVRLYSFPALVATSLRRFFDQQELVVTYREDVAIQLCEFVLEDKPWASPKNSRSEKLLVDVITVVTQHGFTFLSTLDYGRDSDDRIVMAFAKPDHLPPPSAPASSSHPRPSTPHTARSGSPLVPPPNTIQHRDIWALSFISGTVLRVINPPLSSTPAILQSVRTAWPKGVVSEQRLVEGPYEFKLKGYRWFDADNFALDSLQCILALLSSLDTHAFTLLTSISLSNRSRTKDLWIFSGPRPEDMTSFAESSAGSAEGLNLDLRKEPTPPFAHPDGYPPSERANSFHHRRFPSAPAGDLAFAQPSVITSHARSSTEKASSRPTSPTNVMTKKPGSVLRKAPPRTHVSTASTGESSGAQDHEQPSQKDASAPVSGDAENLARAGNVTYLDPSTVALETEAQRPSSRSQPQRMQEPDGEQHDPAAPPDGEQHRVTTPPLLGPNVFGVGPGIFRDSASERGDISDEISCEIPIGWTGHGVEGKGDGANQAAASSEGPGEPLVPGGWRKDFEQEATSAETAEPEDRSTTLRMVEMRAAVPEVKQSHVQSKISQVGIVDMVGTPPLNPYVAHKQRKEKETDKAKREANDRECDGTGQGWVLVTVQSRKHTQEDGTKPQAAVMAGESAPKGMTFPTASTKEGPEGSMAKTVDSVDGKTQSKAKEGAPTRLHGLKRLLSINKGTKSPVSPTSGAKSPSMDMVAEGPEQEEAERARPKERLRSKFRRPSRNEPPKEAVNG